MANQTGKLSIVLTACIAIAICAGGYILLTTANVFGKDTNLKILSSPPGALVLMDGASIGQTPLEPNLPKPGTYTFTFVLNGYRNKTVNYPCYGDCQLMIALQPVESGTVVVESDPDGASVFVNGVDRGSTPLTLHIEPGRHAVTLLKPNYEKLLREISVDNDETVTIKETLIPAVENYYKAAIEAEPDNLYFYCDLMRYYFVKERNEDLLNLITSGIDQFMNGVIDNDENNRFFQEITKISKEAPDLYKMTIVPGIVANLHEKLSGKNQDEKQLANILSNKHAGPVMMDIVAELMKTYPDDPSCISFILSNTAFLYSIIRNMSAEEYDDFLQSIEKAAMDAEPSVEWFTVFKQLAVASLSKRNFELATKYYRLAIDKYCEDVKIDDISDIYYRYVFALARLGKDKEIIELVEEAEKSKLVLAKHLSLMKTEAAKAERRLYPKKPRK